MQFHQLALAHAQELELALSKYRKPEEKNPESTSKVLESYLACLQ